MNLTAGRAQSSSNNYHTAAGTCRNLQKVQNSGLGDGSTRSRRHLRNRHRSSHNSILFTVQSSESNNYTLKNISSFNEGHAPLPRLCNCTERLVNCAAMLSKYHKNIFTEETILKTLSHTRACLEM